MKKIINKFAKATALIAAAALALAISGCDMLQDSLSSEQQKTVDADTGSARVADTNWYYNGCSSSDMSNTTSYLAISFDTVTALSTSGLSGTFEITYTDADSNAASVSKSLDGGYFSSDNKTYYLSMSPVLDILNGSTTSNGTLAVQVNVTGFVCNEGDQKGRRLDSFKKTINVSPLYSSLTLSQNFFGTISSTSDKSIEIPLLAEVALADDAGFEISVPLGSSLPSGITQSDFTLSMSSGGKTILLTPDVEMYNKEFEIDVLVKGIKTSCAEEYTQTFPVTVKPAAVSYDSIAVGSQAKINTDISSVIAANYSTSIVVNVNFSKTPAAWENNRVVIMIDDTSIGSGTTSYDSKNWRNAATYQTVNSSVDFYGYETMKDGKGWDSSTMTIGHTWKVNSDWAYEAYDSTGTNTVQSLTYTIPYTSITDGTTTASSTDTFRIIVFFSDYWSTGTLHAYDVVPYSAATISKTDEDADTVSVDFDSAMILSNEVTTYPTPSVPASFIVKSYTAKTVTLAWSESYSATGYDIYRSTDGSTWGTAIATDLTDTTYIDSTVSVSTEYYYGITAKNTTGASSVKASSAVTTAALSSAPTLSAPTVTGIKVALTWTVVDNAETYSVYRSTTEDGTYTTVKTGVTAEANATSVSCTDNGDSATTYYYKVCGVNAYAEDGAFSEIKSVTTEAVPGSFSVTVGTYEATTATWTAPISWTTSANATSYNVEYKLSSDTTYTSVATAVTTTSSSITGLTMGKKYDVLVTANNGAGSTAADVVNAIPYPAITLDGALGTSEYWTNTNVATTSADSYSDANTYQNMTNLYITNDANNVYVAIVYGTAPADQGNNNTHTNLLFDTAATDGVTSETNVWGIPATTCTYSNGDVNYEAHDFISYDDEITSTLTSSETHTWATAPNGYQSNSAVIEYSIPLSNIGSVGDAVKLFVSISQYTWVSKTDNRESLKDCIPSAAATTVEMTTIANDTLTVDFDSALSYTIK